MKEDQDMNPERAALNRECEASQQAQETEAARYATLLDWGTRLGLLLLLITFASYLLGGLPPHVPLEHLPGAWHLPVEQYLKHTATPTGWGWLAHAGKGDISNLIGIAVLAGSSLPPLLGLIPLYRKRRDYAYASICAAIVLVLVLAASGVLTAGH